MRKLFKDLRAKHINGEVHLTFTARNEGYSIIRILRKEEPKFVFNRDFNEYFDGLNAKDAEVIYEGALDSLNGRKYEYIDQQVQPLKNYAYWVTADEEEIPAGPVPIRIRDPRVWWPQDQIKKQMNLLADKYPSLVEIKNFGKTTKKNDLNGLIIGNKKRCIALIGAIHPGESGPELFIPAISNILEFNSHLLKDVGIAALPCVNIDIREQLVQGHPSNIRKNANGVDLNRNFDANWDVVNYQYWSDSSDPDAWTYRGKYPNSESETQAVIQFIEETLPQSVFTFHCLASICGPRFLTAKSSVDDERFKESCRQVTSEYTSGFYNQEERRTNMSFPSYTGTLPEWLYLKHKIPAFDLEWDGDEESKISHVDETTLELLEKFQKMHTQGIISVLRYYSQ